MRKQLFVAGLLAVTVLLFFAAANKSSCYLDGFTQNELGEQQLVLVDAFPEVSVVINAPSPDTFDKSKKTALVLYALPNGNTIDWTAGKLMEEGDDWHYDIQNIGAQIRFVRDICPDYNWVVAYLQSSQKSWPAWSRARADSSQLIIQHITDSIRAIFAPYNPVVMLNGHSGGGRFIFDYIAGVEAIPSNVERIAFLDSSYGYEDSLHSSKITNWLHASDTHYLDVIAYNDSIVVYNGKQLVSPTGGTWYRSKKMQKDLSSDFAFTSQVDTAFIKHTSLDGRVQFWLKQNYQNHIYHTVLVERNGFIHSLLSGTACENKGYLFWSDRAYRSYIHRTGY